MTKKKLIREEVVLALDIGELIGTEAYEKTRKAAVKRSHEFLDEVEMPPLELALFLSHCMSHLLMAAPEEKYLQEMLAIFLADLDYAGIVKSWHELSEKEKAENRAEAEEWKPSKSIH